MITLKIQYLLYNVVARAQLRGTRHFELVVVQEYHIFTFLILEYFTVIAHVVWIYNAKCFVVLLRIKVTYTCYNLQRSVLIPV